MKISPKQAHLLAKEVVDRMRKANAFEIPVVLKNKIEAFKEKQNDLKAVVTKAEEVLEKHEATFESLIGGTKGVYNSDSLQRILQKVKEGNSPSVSDVEDKIILKSLFADLDDMEAFVKTIINEYSPKKKAVS